MSSDIENATFVFDSDATDLFLCLGAGPNQPVPIDRKQLSGEDLCDARMTVIDRGDMPNIQSSPVSTAQIHSIFPSIVLISQNA